MRLKDLFTVPKGQKITERHLRRVLISSICSILLCMSCLVSTTWAWYIVDIENTENVIQIGKPEVIVTEGDAKLNSGDTLLAGEHTVQIEHGNKVDDLQKKSILYVTLTIQSEGVTKTVYTTLNHENNYRTEVMVTSNRDCTLSWVVTWFAPDGADELTGGTIDVTVEEPTEPPTEEPTETPTEEPTETPTETPTEQPTEPPTEDPTEQPTEAPTETPTEQPTDAPTETPTESEGETTPPTEEVTEPSTETDTETS